MRTIRQPCCAYVYTLGAEHPPIASVACHESVLIDAFEGRPQAADDLDSQACPEPPRIEQIEPAEAFAVSALIPEFGRFTGTKKTATLNQPLPESTRILPIEECRHHFHEKPLLTPIIR